MYYVLCTIILTFVLKLRGVCFLHYRVQTVANIDGDMVPLLQRLLVRLLPLLHLLLPLVGGSAHVDELLVALVSDDGVLDLLPPPRQNFLLNLFRTLRIGDLSVQLCVSYLLLVAWKPSPDENDQGEVHHESCYEGEDEADTEEEAENDVFQGGSRNAERQQED